MSREALTTAIDRSLAYLRASFRRSNDEAGWYHFLDDAKPGVTASAVALRTFAQAGTAFENREAVSAYLLGQQAKSDDKMDGGWPVRTTRGYPVVEATGWVIRSLCDPRAAESPGTITAIRDGCNWLAMNQNTDDGWGPSYGQPSRTFTTALSLLALAEAGADADILGKGAEWLVSSQSAKEPAWGPIPGAPPTLLHTSFALHALSAIGKKLTSESKASTAEWILERIVPGQHTEPATVSEDYDVEYLYNGETLVFQNSLPHFATPVAISVLIAVGVDILQRNVFDECDAILEDQNEDGIWTLPKSPMRPSIWAVWPFIAALSAVRSVCVPHPNSRFYLISTGLAIQQTSLADRQLTRRLVLRGTLVDWFAKRKISLLFLALVACAALVPTALWRYGTLDGSGFVLALVVPAAMALAQVVFESRRKS